MLRTLPLWLWLAACSGTGEPDGTTPTDDSPPTSETADTSHTGTYAVEDPQLINVEVDVPFPEAPLSHRLVVWTDVPTTLTAAWTDGAHTVEVAFPGEGTEHERTLVGWRPGREYTLTVTAANASGGRACTELPVQTDPLPDWFPRADLTVPEPTKIAPGHTLLGMRTPEEGLQDASEIGIVYDEQGEVVWWLATGIWSQDFYESDGQVYALVGVNPSYLRAYGWSGELRTWWTLTETTAPGLRLPVAGEGNLHHDVVAFPGSDEAVGLARYPLPVADFPQDYTDPGNTGPRVVADDVIVWFDEQGTVIDETRLSDLMPTDRIGFDSLGTTAEGWGDWAHANAVLWDDGHAIVSMRHLDAIARIDLANDEIEWLLANPDNWSPELEAKRLQPVGPVRWPYHQHAPMLGGEAPGGERRLLVFDNGNWQASPFTAQTPLTDPLDQSSRVVQYTIDEVAGTVREDWSFDQSTVAGAPLFSGAVGDADYLDNGNVLSTWGFVTHRPDGTPNRDAGLGEMSVRIIELDPATLSDVWHLELTTPQPVNGSGWTAYRADRIPSLYGRVVD